MAKSSRRQVLLFLLINTRLDLLDRIRLHFKVSENLMDLIFFDTIWFLHIRFVSLVKFESLARFPMDHPSHPVDSSLVVFLCLFAALFYYQPFHLSQPITDTCNSFPYYQFCFFTFFSFFFFFFFFLLLLLLLLLAYFFYLIATYYHATLGS